MSLQWTTDSTDINETLTEPPATMQEIFNTWDRCLPVSSVYYTGDSDPALMSGDARAWYYDSNLGSFVQPNNTGNWQHFVSPPGYYSTEYTHDVVVKSSSTDDDGIGVAGAFYRDEQTGHNYSIMFVRSQGGVTPQGGWGVIVQASGTPTGGGSTDTRGKIIPGLGACGLNIGGVARNGGPTGCANSIGTNGWSSRTTRIRVERSGNILTAWCSPWGASDNVTRTDHVLDSNSHIVIDLDNTPFPPGYNLTSWDVFKRPTGVGFNTYSQPNSYYLDWSYTPPIGEQIIDMSNDTDGQVHEWNTQTNAWFIAADNLWDYVGRQNTIITDPRDGKTLELTCADYTCDTYISSLSTPYTNPSQITSIDSDFDASVDISVTTIQSDQDENNDGVINPADIEVLEWSSLVGDYTFTQTNTTQRPYRSTYDRFNVIGFNNIEGGTTQDTLSRNNSIGNTLLGETSGVRDFTVWIVGRMGSLPTSGGYYPIISEGGNYMGIARSGSTFMKTNSSSQLTANTNQITTGENFILQYSNRFDTDGTMTIKKNNTLLATGDGNTGNYAASTNMFGFSGNNQDSLIFEIIVKKGSTTDTIDEQMTGFLAHKWRLTELLSSDHLYKLTPPGN